MDLEKLHLQNRDTERTNTLLKGVLPYVGLDLATPKRTGPLTTEGIDYMMPEGDEPLSRDGRGPKRARPKIKGWMLALVGAIVLVVLGFLAFSQLGKGPEEPEEPTERTAAVDRGPIVVTLGVLGNLEPETQADLAFEAQGIVAEVAVEEGDVAQAGDMLAKLDTTDLDLAVAQAEQTVALQEASLNHLLIPPDPEQVRVAQAQLEQASLSLALAVEQRDSANFDLAIAQAEQAVAIQQAQLDDLQSGPDPEEVRIAQAQLEQAELSLQEAERQADQQNFDLAIEHAEQAVAIQEANIEALEDDDIDDDDQDAQFDIAEAQLEQAEIALEQARRQRDAASLDLAIEQARQAVAIQQAKLDDLQSGPDSEAMRTAEAQLEQARLSLEEARRNSDPTELDNAVLQAGQALAIQQATFDDLISGPDQTEVDMAAAQLEQAKLSLEQAKQRREAAFLRAPFDGVVMEVNVTVGETTGTGPAVRLADVDPLHITAELDEVDIARVIEGQEVQIELDALPDLPVTGHVVHIAPEATEDQGVVTYDVRIDLDPSAAPLRPGMTATADITTMRLEDVLRVPNWAVRFDSQTGQAFVSVRREEDATEDEGGAGLIPLAGPRRANGRAGTSLEGVEEIPVELGMRDDTYSEVLSGLQEGDVVVVSLERQVNFFDNGEE